MVYLCGILQSGRILHERQHRLMKTWVPTFQSGFQHQGVLPSTSVVWKDISQKSTTHHFLLFHHAPAKLHGNLKG